MNTENQHHDVHKPSKHRPARTILDLNRDELLELIRLFMGNVLVHYGMWFTECVHQFGCEQTLELERKAFYRYAPLAMKKLMPHLKSDKSTDMAHPLSQKNHDELVGLIKDLAKTWVASDGVWFQAVETHAGMAAAKEINDRCWANFAKLEASKITRFLGLQPGCGLLGLQAALEFRTYSVINRHTSEVKEDGSLVLTLQECRVQDSRRRKKMDDYPCKTAGVIEYSSFATFVDNRIQTQCLYCPPDPVVSDHYCSWRFVIGEGRKGS